MQITTSITLDLQEPAVRPVICATQGDRNTRCLEAAICLGGTDWEIPADAVVSMRYSKPDGTLGYYDTMPDGTIAASIRGNVVTMQMAPQLFTVAGSVLAQLEFLQGENILGTGCLMIQVEANPAADAVEAEDYIQWLQWMKHALQEAIDKGDFTGPKGDTGPRGETGAPGRTPVKGTDYWTAEDRQAIVADVLTALPVWEGGSY